MKGNVRVVVDRKWIEVRLQLTTTPCVWALCERKAVDLNESGRPLVTPADVLAWVGLWRLDSEVRAIRPVEGCDCLLCLNARKDGAT